MESTLNINSTYNTTEGEAKSVTILERQVIDEFIFEMTIISPLEKLIKQLENKEFRDCDVEYLNQKLSKFTNLALEVLGMKFNLPNVEGIMNNYTRNKFSGYFQTLLTFFKNLK